MFHLNVWFVDPRLLRCSSGGKSGVVPPHQTDRSEVFPAVLRSNRQQLGLRPSTLVDERSEYPTRQLICPSVFDRDIDLEKPHSLRRTRRVKRRPSGAAIWIH